MIFVKLNLIIITFAGFIMFGVVKCGETDVENGEAKTVSTTEQGETGAENGEATTVSTTEQGPTDAEKDIRANCKNTLGESDLNGRLVHDAFQFDPENEEKINVTVKNYLRHVHKLMVKVTTIDTNLIFYYCDNIDPLQRLGFTGNYVGDKLKDKKIFTPESLNDVRQKYTQFLGLSTTVQLNKESFLADRQVDMIFQYAESNNLFNNPITKNNSGCKENLYSKTFVETDEQFQEFVNHLFSRNVTQTNKDLVIIYCEIIVGLRASGFKGEIEDTTLEPSDKVYQDLADGYKFYISKVSSFYAPGYKKFIEDYAFFRIIIN